MTPKELFNFDIFCVSCKSKEFYVTSVEVLISKDNATLLDPPDSNQYKITGYGGEVFILVDIICDSCGRKQSCIVGSRNQKNFGMALFKHEHQAQEQNK